MLSFKVVLIFHFYIYFYTVMKFLGASQNSDTALIGVEYDSSVSFVAGTKFAPNAIRQASISIEEFSFDLKKSLDDINFADLGNIDEIPIIPNQAFDYIKEQVINLLKAHNIKKLLTIGGDHSITFPVISALVEKLKLDKFALIHFDAHADLRKEFEGTSFSHACVINNIISNFKVELYQIGIRSTTKEEYEFMKKNDTLIKEPELLKKISIPTYITFDVDVFDPALMPATGTIEAGGLFYKEVIEFLKNINWINVFGIDIVEFNPVIDNFNSYASVIAKLIREMLLLWLG